MKKNKGPSVAFACAALVGLVIAYGGVAHGAAFTWDASGGTPLNDGSGAWNATGGTNWFDGTTYGAWGNTNADTATFGVANGAAGTITVGNVTVNAITFDAPGSGNYTLSSGTITMAGTSPTMTVNASGTTTISSILAGSDNWTKSGTGTLLLSNGATFSISGTTTVNAGILALNGPNTATGLLGNSAGFVVNNGGTIRVDSLNALMGWSNTNLKPVTLNSGGLLTLSDGQSAHIGGVLTLAGGTLGGSSAVQWGGWWLDNATTTITENSTISGANVVLSNATANTFDVATGKTLLVSGNFGYGSSNNGLNGKLTKIGSGTMTLAGANTYTGTTSVNAGTLQIGNNGATGSIAAASAVTGSPGAVLAFNRTDNYGGNFSNPISGGLALTINSGTIAFTGTNTYTGVTTLNAGVVNLGSAETVGTSGPLGASASANPGSIVLAGGTLQYSASNANDYSGRFSTASNQRYNVDTNSRSVTFATALSSTGGSLTKLGSGTLALSAANTYTGTTTPSAGTLRLDNNLALQNSVLNTSGGGSLALGSGITTPTIGGLAGSTNLATAFSNWSQATALTLNPLSGTATYTGVIAEGAVGTTLTKTGSGTQVLQSASSYTYTGTTTVNGGILALNGPNSATGLLGNSAGFVINNGGTIRVDAFNALMGFTNAKPVTVNAGGLLTMPDGNSAWMNGPLTLAGGTLAGGFSSAYGGWILGNGTTTVTENSAITATNVVLSNASANVFDVAAGKTLAVTGYFGWGSDASSKRNGNLTKSGAGTMSLTAANFYTGTTTVNGGVLAVGGNNSTTFGVLGRSAGFVINDGGTIRVDTDNALMGFDATNTKPVSLNAGGLLTINGVTAHIAGVLTLAGGTLAGTPSGQWGAWWLDNATTSVTENSTISAGNVVLTATTSNGFDVAAGKTLLVTGNFGYGSSTIGLNGRLTKLGSGTMTLAGANTYTGTTAIHAGTLQIGNSGTTGSLTASSAITGSAGGMLAFARTDAYGGNVSNTISGGLGILLRSGTLTLAGSNSYTGGTQVNAGTLKLGSSTALPTSSSLTLGTGSSAGVLAFNGNTATLGTITFNGSGSQLSETGKLNLLATGTANATITVASGSHALHPDTTLQSNTVIDTAAGSFFSLHGVIDGAKALTKLGSGTLSISGINSYSGGTYLNGGYVSVLNTGGLGSGTSTVTIDGNTVLNLNNTILSNPIVFGSGSGAIINSGTLVNVTGTYSITSGTGSSITTNYSVQSGGDIAFVSNLASTVYVQGTAVGTFSADVLEAGTVIVNAGGRGSFSGSLAGNVTTSGSSLFSGGVLGNVTVAGGTATFSGATGASSAINVNSGLSVMTGTIGGIAHATTAAATLEINGRVLSTADVNAEAGSTVKLLGSQAFEGTTIDNDGSVIVDRTANLVLAAVISGSGSLQKSDNLTLTLTGNNTFTGLTTISGGTLSVGNGGSSGALAGNVLNNAALIFNRSDDSSYAGNVSGSGNLTKLGGGKLTLTGSSSYAGSTTVSNGGLAVNGQIASSVDVASGATLGGSGKIVGNVGGDGLIAPGNSPGILTVTGQVDATEITAFAFEFSQTGAPAWSNASNSLNDVLRLTGTSPFTNSLASTNAINVYFDVTNLVNGDTFLGGFFVDNPNSTSNLLATGLGSAVFNYFVKGDGNGPNSYNGGSYYTLAEFMATHAGITGVTQSVVPVASANFADGTITTGQVTQFVVVPEPGTAIVAGIGIMMAAWSLGKRRHGSQALR